MEDLKYKKGPNNRESLDMRLRNMDFIELVMGSGWRLESENKRSQVKQETWGVGGHLNTILNTVAQSRSILRYKILCT